MKKILFVTVALSLFARCNSQEKKAESQQQTSIKQDTLMQTVEKLDFQFLEKNGKKTKPVVISPKFEGEANGYEYYKEFEDKTVHISGNEINGYVEKVIYNDRLIIPFKSYYPNGGLRIKGQVFKKNFQKGIWYYYDSKGYLTKKVNYDAPFQYTWEDILIYAKKNNINLKNEAVQITRKEGKMAGTPYWEIYFLTDKETKYKIVRIDGRSGKIIHEEEGPFSEIE